jgi:hypothetical protein
MKRIGGKNRSKQILRTEILSEMDVEGLNKDTTITFRLSRMEKLNMEQTARGLGYSLAEYLRQVHRLIEEKLRR